MFTSERFVEGDIYTREYLRKKFGIRDATINTGIFQPPNSQSIWLFVTENKRNGIPQYKDQLHENTLYWDGQNRGRKDQLIITHETKNLELLVFYRKNRDTYSDYGFKYEGRFRYVSHEGAQPAHFMLQRVATKKNDTPSKMISGVLHGLKEEINNSVVKEKNQLRLVYCYAHEDKALRDELDKHLSILKRLYQIVSWHDRKISPGMEWEKEIDVQLNAANIILLLISSDFMASDYCYGVEMQRAIARHKQGEAKVIPIILRPITSWQATPIGKLKALPTDGVPVVDRKWYMLDYALENVAIGIREVINQ
jgi:TIR domain